MIGRVFLRSAALTNLPGNDGRAETACSLSLPLKSTQLSVRASRPLKNRTTFPVRILFGPGPIPMRSVNKGLFQHAARGRVVRCGPIRINSAREMLPSYPQLGVISLRKVVHGQQ